MIAKNLWNMKKMVIMTELDRFVLSSTQCKWTKSN